MPDVSETGQAFDVHGRRVAVGQDEGAVYLDTGLHRYLYEGRELENLREAIDRAAMLGQPERDTCRACLDTGLIPVEKCNCGSPADASVGYIHERLCGYEQCPAGCPVSD